VRVTILGGDVHLAAVGQFYSNENLGIKQINDYRYMLNVFQPLAPLILDRIFGNCKHAAFEDRGKPIVFSW